jgi:hypothetical protein
MVLQWAFVGSRLQDLRSEGLVVFLASLRLFEGLLSLCDNVYSFSTINYLS